METHIFTCAEHAVPFNTPQHTLDSNFTSTKVSVPDTMEGSASQTRCTLRQRRMEHCSSKKQRREKGKRWSTWWKNWTNNRVWTKKGTSGPGTSEQALSGQHSHLQLANKQDPAVPSTFTGSLVFNGRKQKSPPSFPLNTRNQGRENIGCLTKNGFIFAYYFVLVCACCFPRCWPETAKSNSVSVRPVSVQPQCAHNGQVYLTPSTRLSV